MRFFCIPPYEKVNNPKTMKKNIIIVSMLLISLVSCQKKMDSIVSNPKSSSNKIVDFVKYTIPKGERYSDKTGYNLVKYQQLSFIVKFDSSAIYTTQKESNQHDINKLYGFSDNNGQHHQFSARFGWRWSNNALRLFGYIYNNGAVSVKELGTVVIGSENICSIKVNSNTYTFSLKGKETSMPRLSTTPTAEGYKLYPYFGGTEMAPHTITISIKEL